MNRAVLDVVRIHKDHTPAVINPSIPVVQSGILAHKGVSEHRSWTRHLFSNVSFMTPWKKARSLSIGPDCSYSQNCDEPAIMCVVAHSLLLKLVGGCSVASWVVSRKTAGKITKFISQE